MISFLKSIIFITFGYSNKDVTFLDVNIKIKVFLKRLQIVISTLNFHNVILFYALHSL